MANYLLKYKGKYRILPTLDLSTNDFPRELNGALCDTDIYITCQYGNKIFNYGNGTLIAYIPSKGRGRNIIKILTEKNVAYTNLVETDEEIEFRFKAKDIDTIAELLKAKTSGAGISPFSTKNLPKRKDVEIPTEEIARYKEISGQVAKEDLLVISRITNSFLTDVIEKDMKRRDKSFEITKDIRKKCLARQVKEYIYLEGYWDRFLEYFYKNISKKE